MYCRIRSRQLTEWRFMMVPSSSSSVFTYCCLFVSTVSIILTYFISYLCYYMSYWWMMWHHWLQQKLLCLNSTMLVTNSLWVYRLCLIEGLLARLFQIIDFHGCHDVGCFWFECCLLVFWTVWKVKYFWLSFNSCFKWVVHLVSLYLNSVWQLVLSFS